MSETLLKKVRAYMVRERMTRPGEKVLVGLSGGLDSVCLLDVLYQLRDGLSLSVEAAHLNHMLRPGAADEDEAFVRELCARYAIPCHTQRTDVGETAKARGEGVELVGREARYDFFRSIGTDKIAVAHHLSDQAETLIMHLLRGAGAEGLSGMAPIEGKLIRPFLEISREELLAYAKERGLSWREDASNAEDEYQRNRIRHRVIPLFREENPQAEAHIAACAAKLREDHEALEEMAESAFSELVTREPDGTFRADARELLSLPRAVRVRVLCRMTAECGFIGEAHLRAVEALLTNDTGKRVSLPGNTVAERENHDLCVGAPHECPPPFRMVINGTGEYRLPDGRCLCVAETGDGIRIHADAVVGELCARSRKPGDRFTPHKGNGEKKVKDYFIDRKIPRRERERAVIIEDDAGILAVLPFASDERAVRCGENARRKQKSFIIE